MDSRKRSLPKGKEPSDPHRRRRRLDLAETGPRSQNVVSRQWTPTPPGVSSASLSNASRYLNPMVIDKPFPISRQHNDNTAKFDVAIPAIVSPPPRPGTPLSPLSEELFGDILDANPPALPLRDDWSDSEEQENLTPKKKIAEAKGKSTSQKGLQLSQLRDLHLKKYNSLTDEDLLVLRKVLAERESDSRDRVGLSLEDMPPLPIYAEYLAGKIPGFLPQHEERSPFKIFSVTTKTTFKHKAPEAEAEAEAEGTLAAPPLAQPSSTTNTPTTFKSEAPKATGLSISFSIPNTKPGQIKTPTAFNPKTPEGEGPFVALSVSSAQRFRDGYVEWPLFCSMSQLIKSQHGDFGDAGLGPVVEIYEFKRNMINRPDVSLAKESIAEALYKAAHYFEVTVEIDINIDKDVLDNRGKKAGKQSVTKKVELSRYFLPSPTDINKYVEIHAKDLVYGKNPALDSMGFFAGKCPFVIYECTCPKPNLDLCHAAGRTITVVKNHSKGFNMFAAGATRQVSGRWLVGGDTRRWGLDLRDAKEIWENSEHPGNFKYTGVGSF